MSHVGVGFEHGMASLFLRITLWNESSGSVKVPELRKWNSVRNDVVPTPNERGQGQPSNFVVDQWFLADRRIDLAKLNWNSTALFGSLVAPLAYTRPHRLL